MASSVCSRSVTVACTPAVAILDQNCSQNVKTWGEHASAGLGASSRDNVQTWVRGLGHVWSLGSSVLCLPLLNLRQVW